MSEVKDILMDRVKHYEKVRAKFPDGGRERYNRLTDARNTLLNLHDDIAFWGDHYDESKP